MVSDRRPAQSPYLITAPTPAIRQYDLVVMLPSLRPGRKPPCLRILADCETDDVRASIHVRRVTPEEGT
jgi:hypothetical protein